MKHAQERDKGQLHVNIYGWPDSQNMESCNEADSTSRDKQMWLRIPSSSTQRVSVMGNTPVHLHTDKISSVSSYISNVLLGLTHINSNMSCIAVIGSG